MKWGTVEAMMHIGDPEKIDRRGFITLEDNPTVVFPGYRMKELPRHLADQMVEFIDLDRETGFVWCLDDPDDRLLARVVRCGIRASDDSGLEWSVLVDDSSGEVLVAGSHFRTWTKPVTYPTTMIGPRGTRHRVFGSSAGWLNAFCGRVGSMSRAVYDAGPYPHLRDCKRCFPNTARDS